MQTHKDVPLASGQNLLFVTHPAVLNTSTGNKRDLFKFTDKYCIKGVNVEDVKYNHLYHSLSKFSRHCGKYFLFSAEK